MIKKTNKYCLENSNDIWTTVSTLEIYTEANSSPKIILTSSETVIAYHLIFVTLNFILIKENSLN